MSKYQNESKKFRWGENPLRNKYNVFNYQKYSSWSHKKHMEYIYNDENHNYQTEEENISTAYETYADKPQRHGKNKFNMWKRNKRRQSKKFYGNPKYQKEISFNELPEKPILDRTNDSSKSDSGSSGEDKERQKETYPIKKDSFNTPLNLNTPAYYINKERNIPNTSKGYFPLIPLKNESIGENTEILIVKLKLSPEKEATIIIRRYDNVFNTVRIFCEINKINEQLIKPLLMKIFAALNTVYAVYNSRIKADHLERLELVKDIMNQRKKHSEKGMSS
ncbi:MAG: hypothetical protein MJ252_09865 [archaeon]|nr:hypothetical protein [archaeon]